MQKPPNPFADLAHRVLPEQTSGRLARIGRVDQRVSQRWMSGEASVPDDVVLGLEKQLEILKKIDPMAHLEHVIANWRHYGLQDEVIGSYLSAVYENFLHRKIR